MLDFGINMSERSSARRLLTSATSRGSKNDIGWFVGMAISRKEVMVFLPLSKYDKRKQFVSASRAGKGGIGTKTLP